MPWLPGVNLDGIDEILPRFREVGVNFISLTLAAGAGLGSSVDSTIRAIARVRREIEERSDWLILATSVDEIRQAQAAGKLAVNFNFQETLPFGSDLGMIQAYYDLGVRQALLAYNQRNLVGDGCAERADAGLSNFGVEVVKEMNRVGMLVDGSPHMHTNMVLECVHCASQPEFGVWSIWSLASAHTLCLPTTWSKYFKQSSNPESLETSLRQEHSVNRG